MSRLEELIQRYCPDGVEWKPLNSIGTIKRGNGLQKKDFVKTGVGCIHYGQIYTKFGLFADKTLTFVDEELASHLLKVEKGDLVIACTSENVEDVCKAVAWLGDETITTGGHSCVLHHNQDPKYVAYFFQSELFQSQKKKYAYGTKVIDIKPDNIGKIEIPIPPMPVQEEIVRILDSFTELQAELQAELQKRKQQYNYYLDNLLSFNDINRGGYREEVRWMKMSEVGTFYSGLSGKSKDDFQNGNAKFITYVNVFNHPALETDVEDKVKIMDGEKQNTVQYGDLLFTGSSETPDECGMCSVLTHHTDEKLYLNSFCFGFRFNNLSGINPDFMKFLFRSSAIRKLICKTANGVTRYNVSKKEFAKIVIPIPSIEIQNQIATILDKFYSLIGDISIGLPAEIEKRQQQYEYYRDRLLTFKRKGA